MKDVVEDIGGRPTLVSYTCSRKWQGKGLGSSESKAFGGGFGRPGYKYVSGTITLQEQSYSRTHLK
jgi:hypothetical protein